MSQWNCTNATQKDIHTFEVDVAAFCGIVLFAVPSICANVLVAATILYSRDLRNQPTYMAMTALAFLDLPHSFVVLYPMGGSILTGRNLPSFEWRLYPINVIYPAWYCTCMCYITIAVNRYLTICHPHLNEMIFSKAKMLAWMATWPLFAIALMSPMLSGRCCPIDFTPELWLMRYEQCRDHETNYQLAMCYLASATATAISSFVYLLSYLRIRSMKKQISGSNTKSAIKNTDIKLVLQFSVLNVVFTFTWIVIHFEASLGPARADGILCYFGLVGYAAMTGVNPLVYLTMNSTLRHAAGNLLAAIGLGGLFSSSKPNQQGEPTSKSQTEATGMSLSKVEC